MFRQWSVTNFKSIGGTQSLELSPLTVLAGANNSGKSSFLQSILIVAQTMRSMRGGPAALLEGPLFSGGAAEELVHQGHSDFSIGFIADGGGEETIDVDAQFRVASGASFGEKEFRLERCALTVKSGAGEALETLDMKRRRQAWRGFVGSAPPAWLRLPGGLNYMPRAGETWPPDVVGVSLLQILPQWGIERRDARVERFAEIIRYLTFGRSAGSEGEPLEKEAIEVARTLLKDPGIKTVRDIGAGRRASLRRYRGRDIPKALQHLFRNRKGDFRWRQRPLPPLLETGVGTLRLLAGSVKHIGPLRLPPQFVYAPSARVEEGAVGSGGEFTAAELHRMGSTPVVCPDPKTGEESEIPLRRAVEMWLRHMGVLERIVTYHRPKIGHYIYVKAPQLRRFVDLTGVGVGASQILPVVVQCLAAPPGSVLIFEQPELHLHPRVQSLLGDFLLAVARTGRQCIVETHSEHIVNRIRLRIAEAEDQEIRSVARIYFAEREGLETRFREVAINEYGAIEDWPEGFFDESVAESERILASSLRKRSTRE